MPVTLKIAFRNLLEHKAKSVIVGMLLTLGVIILVLGNAALEAASRGIETSFISNYTGHVIITGASDAKVSIFGIQSMTGLEDTPQVPEYDKILNHVRELKGVRNYTAMATSFTGFTSDARQLKDAQKEDDDDGVTVRMGPPGENDPLSFGILFGIDATTYWQMFESITLVQGTMIQPGQKGIMVPEDKLARLEKQVLKPVKIGDEIDLQGFGGAGMRIRSVPLVGTFKRPTDSAGPDNLCYIDIDTLRVMSGLTVGANESITLSASQTSLLDTSDIDALFSDDMFAEPQVAVSATTDLDNILGDTSNRERLNTADTGAWNAMLLRLDSPSRANAVIADLNAWFAENKISAKAGDWQVAAGQFAQSTEIFRIIFIIFVLILSVVVVIIIMNTLVVSVIERTAEIGTMRALGANKGFVRQMFIAETSVLSGVFGLLGIALAAISVLVINTVQIKAGNQFWELLFGGKVLQAYMEPWSLIGSLVLIVLVGLLAHIYPVTVALRIQPVQAMQTE